MNISNLHKYTEITIYYNRMYCLRFYKNQKIN